MLKNKFLSLILSLLIAFTLWAYVITFISSEREDTFYNVPVAFQGEALLEDRGLMLVSDEKPTVTVTLQGKRTNLNKLDSSNIIIVADLTKIYEAGSPSLSYSISYPGDLPSTAFTIMSQYPTMVKVLVERKITKEVPVNILYSGKLAEDCIVDKENIELNYEKVTISGPASVIDQITQAQIQVDLEDRSDSFIESYRYILCDSEGQPVDAEKVEVNVPEVTLTLSILRVKEIPLEVTVISGGGATQATSTITIEPKSIKVSGNDKVLADLEKINLGNLDLGELIRDSEVKFDIKLPSGVNNLTGKEEAAVTVKFPKLTTQTFTLTEFSALNVPEGMEVEFITEELLVTVRGETALVAKMSAKDLSLTVDFTGAQTGTFTIKANVVMGSGYTRVGALGSYEVSVTLTETKKTK